MSSSETAPNGPLTRRTFLKVGVEFQKIEFSLDEHSPQVSRIYSERGKKERKKERKKASGKRGRETEGGRERERGEIK
jgi:hypothetical protein